MSFDQVFDDSESKPRPDQVSGTSAVDTVEVFKKQVQIANAAVSESQKAFEECANVFSFVMGMGPRAAGETIADANHCLNTIAALV